jgi:hypothetical protein
MWFDGETKIEIIMSRLDHWAALSLGDDWMKAAEALAPHNSQAAENAYLWAKFCFTLYNKAWTAHAGASRWDPDGSDFLAEVDTALEKLHSHPIASDPLPSWASELLDGNLPAMPLETDSPILVNLAEIAAKLGGK